MGLFGKSAESAELEKLGAEVRSIRTALHGIHDDFGQQKDELARLKAVLAEQQECMQSVQSKAAESIDLIAKVRSESHALAKKAAPSSDQKLEDRLKALEAAYESLRSEMESRKASRAPTMAKISNSEELNMALSENARRIDEALGAIEKMAKIIAK